MASNTNNYFLRELNPRSNGVTFLTGHPNQNHKLVNTLLQQYNFQRGWNNNNSTNNGRPYFPPTRISFCSSTISNPATPSPPIDADLLVHFVEISAHEVFMLGPTNAPALRQLLFQKICSAFAVPEYYGYHFDTLYHFLGDLSWLSQPTRNTNAGSNDRRIQGHVLVISIIPSPHINNNSTNMIFGESLGTTAVTQNIVGNVGTLHLQLLEFVWRLLEETAKTWSSRHVTFHTYVLDRSPVSAATRVSL